VTTEKATWAVLKTLSLACCVGSVSKTLIGAPLHFSAYFLRSGDTTEKKIHNFSQKRYFLSLF
ncbi:hypothetical protein ACRFPF_004562, partial [Salmonella enterica subsp. enterica serovar Kentucky]